MNFVFMEKLLKYYKFFSNKDNQAIFELFLSSILKDHIEIEEYITDASIKRLNDKDYLDIMLKINNNRLLYITVNNDDKLKDSKEVFDYIFSIHDKLYDDGEVDDYTQVVQLNFNL